MKNFGRINHKYGMSANGSKLEKSVGEMLRLRELAGEIKELREQVRVQICCDDPGCPGSQKIHSIVDFAAIDAKTGEEIFFEAKGLETTDYRIKRRLWLHHGRGQMEVWAGTYARPRLKEILEPKREGEKR